ncbi:hypothetical protein OG21DRAFT_1512285 [Imleria badia]|nr:hypothetical protein OG21DRAFT_1512285 [Imleria badia]
MSEIHPLSQCICTHKHLESLELSVPTDDVALRHAILSPRLRVVSLVLHPHESNLGNIRITSADSPFLNVEEMELNVWDLHLFLDSYDHGTRCSVRSVSILLFYMMQKLPVLSLLYWPRLSVRIPSTISVNWCSFHSTRSLNDEELADLIRSWPMHETLRLNCNHACYATSITLGGFVIGARCSTSL